MATPVSTARTCRWKAHEEEAEDNIDRNPSACLSQAAIKRGTKVTRPSRLGRSPYGGRNGTFCPSQGKQLTATNHGHLKSGSSSDMLCANLTAARKPCNTCRKFAQHPQHKPGPKSWMKSMLETPPTSQTHSKSFGSMNWTTEIAAASHA
jgi:hypothetical protein